ncbi:Ribosomal RNA adenine dimethylase [Rosistilla carotiformis]|uniref:Ribosomal RNA small subunit methyltransferase A n=1 Tax=Rosistilla carotiformis TaxID=2528017 RepID=A0A518JLV0_9BACT|nr:16S rRNA (adenine(1518)-N(6)/adenine(1519)-N(6))-dimethyltransferase RsmA [Rosistilla carotiformis]QDV66523.1 Ribosomal RNA adenine dimethylase [Rosistilla carotiformis]
MVNRQTASYLTKRFQQTGMRPLSRFGQNFLIDLNLVDLIADSADIDDRDLVLEIGTGTGSLTTRLAARAAHVITVEIDTNLAQIAQEELEDLPNVTMRLHDALKNKNNFDPELLENIRQEFDKLPAKRRRFKLVANLPYNVATPIISNLLRNDPIPDVISVTIQKELADRIVAPPGTKDYSALSIWIQSVANASIVRTLPPGVFWPPPKVTSAIIRIDTDANLRARIDNIDFFHEKLRALYFHRRKFLRSVVLSAMKGELDKAQVDAVLEKLGFSGEIRAERLTVAQTIELINELGTASAEAK